MKPTLTEKKKENIDFFLNMASNFLTKINNVNAVYIKL